MGKRTTIPRSAGQLRAWLRDTETGHEILKEASRGFLEDECRKCQKLRPYPKVLVVVRRLGTRPGVEVFYEKGVSVRLEELVDSKDDKELEILVETLLVDQLPKSWKTLPDSPGYRRDSMVFTGLSAITQFVHSEDLKLIRELQEFKRDQNHPH